MKLPKAKKLPSGNWRIQIAVNGKRYSITDPDPKVVKQIIAPGIAPEKKRSHCKLFASNDFHFDSSPPERIEKTNQ